uniref:Uncharacterized protein n=1 Tax=Meloidogyne enterolobii TaxID=390850 RepID=A0A6V7WGB8_MELEN|nr:unnamed protein product [Meloidogyne enterolobii]
MSQQNRLWLKVKKTVRSKECKLCRKNIFWPKSKKCDHVIYNLC